MNNFEDIKRDIQNLMKQGMDLYHYISQKKPNIYESNNLSKFIANYEVWYTHAQLLIRQLIPDRLQDFIALYGQSSRKEITISNYCISDALRAIVHQHNLYGPWTAALCVFRQIEMLKACLQTFDSKIYNLQNMLRADIFDSEIESARYLEKHNFLRAAGAICGVVMEKHLSEVCLKRNIEIKKKKNLSIADYNDVLKDKVYDTMEWRKIQRLGDIRNLCDHDKKREPTSEEVEELISGTDWLVKTIF